MKATRSDFSCAVRRVSRMRLKNSTSRFTVHVFSLPEPAEEAVDDRLAVLFVDGLGERERHGAGAHAVLRVAAVGDAVVAHDGRESVVARYLARGVHVHQAHL